MDDEATILRTIRGQTLALVAQLTASPKPSYEVDGRSVSWESYLAELRRTLEWCDVKLAACEPFEFDTQART